MILKILTVLIASCAVLRAHEEDIRVLTDENFEEIRDYPLALILFYAPWCQHCQQFKPEFAVAVEEFRNYEPPVVFAQVDCTKAGDVSCSKYEISGYPSLKLFRNGEFMQDYKGNRDSQSVIEYVKEQLLPSSRELKSAKDLEDFVAENDVITLVGIFQNNTNLKQIFLNFADKQRDKYKFAHIDNNIEIAEARNIEDALIMFRPSHLHNNFEENFVIYTGNNDINEITKFINENRHGLVGHRTQQNIDEFGVPLTVVYYDIDYKKNPKGTKYWRNRILKVASQFKDKMNFAVSSIEDFTYEILDFNVTSTTRSTPIALAKDINMKKYKMTDEFSGDNLKNFVSNLLEGKLTPYVKSEEVPLSNDEAVKIAVAANFQEVVIDNDKDTFIEFYAPWCGHCRSFEPTYNELGKRLQDENIVIAKMNAIANDVPENLKVTGFPTIYWLAKNSKNKPVTYTESRELDILIKYIAEHATEELKNYDRNGMKKEAESLVKTEL